MSPKGFLLLLGIGWLTAGCSGPQEPGGETSPPSYPVVEATPTPRYLPTPIPRSQAYSPARTLPTPTPTPTLEPEPDWNALVTQLKTKYLPQFKAPAILSECSLRLRTGTEYTGKLMALNDNSVSIRSDRAALTLERSQLHALTRIQFFADDFATYKAKQEVAPRKAAYDQRKKAFSQHTPSRATGEPVQAVIDYLDRTLVNPRSTIFLRWYPPVEDEKGTQVRVKYKTESSGFGMITERKNFFLNHAGRVYQVAGYKEIE